MSSPRLPAANLALLAVGVLAVSAAAPLIAYATMVPALALAMWRGGLAAALLAPYALVARRQELRRVSRRDLAWTCLAGVCLAGHFGLWIASLTLTSVAASTALVTLQAAWVVIITWLRGVSVPRVVWVGMLVAVSGVIVITGIDVATSREAVIGDLLALAGGLLSAFYTLIGGHVRARVSTTSYTFICYTVSALVLVPILIATTTETFDFGWRGWLVIVAITVTSQLLGHSVFNHLLATMSPTEVTLALLLEVPGAALIAAVALGQAPPPAIYAGLGLILIGLIVVVRAQPEAAAHEPTQASSPSVGPPTVAG